MFVVDTNILVYARDSGAREHDKCKRLLEDWRRSPAAWYTTWSILYEFLRVVTHPRVFRRPLSLEEAWHFLDSIFASRGLRILANGSNHATVAATTFGEIQGIRGNLLHDAHTAILMREHGIRRIYTRDTDFHRFPFLEVIDPLSM